MEVTKHKYAVFKVDGQEFEMRRHFGSVLTEDNNITTIMKRTSYGLEKQLSS